MELHCSQTLTHVPTLTLPFETPMELHCSQTRHVASLAFRCLRPLWNYTALKRLCICLFRALSFETPMELHCSQTSFSTVKKQNEFETPMELHCSQTVRGEFATLDSLRPLWNYTALKHNRVSERKRLGLRPLWNYTALKQLNVTLRASPSLRPLWNYTALKLEFHSHSRRLRLRPLWNYTALKLYRQPSQTSPV